MPTGAVSCYTAGMRYLLAVLVLSGCPTVTPGADGGDGGVYLSDAPARPDAPPARELCEGCRGGCGGGAPGCTLDGDDVACRGCVPLCEVNGLPVEAATFCPPSSGAVRCDGMSGAALRCWR